MLIYRSQPSINDLPLAEIRRFASLHPIIEGKHNLNRSQIVCQTIDDMRNGNYKITNISGYYFQLALLEIMDELTDDEQEQIRLFVVNQLAANFTSTMHFVPININKKQYWILILMGTKNTSKNTIKIKPIVLPLLLGLTISIMKLRLCI